jgi:ATP-binding cassette ChvD family protein
VGILMQEPTLNEDKTVLGNVEEGLGQIKADVDRFNAISAEMGEPDADFDTLMEEMGQLQEKIDAADAWDLDSQLEQAMDALRCPPPDADVTILSGGERRRVALCKLLLQKPDLLLLDEPTNHLDAESVLWLEQHLAAYHGAVLAVTHDRYFLDHVAQWIAEIDRGRLYPYEGNYSTYLQKKSERLTIQGKKDAKLARRLTAELEWVRSNAKARAVKSKARLSRYEEMAAEADRTRKLDFEEIQIPPGPRLGGTVIEVNNLKKGYDGRVLIDNLSFTLPRNGIVGVIGANGVGKTTLFKTIVGLETPDEGNVKVGETVKISYVDQSRSGLDPTKNLWETVSDGLDYMQVGHVEIPSRAYVSQFGFKGPDQQKMTGVLSGGERNRLNLALTLKVGGNLLLLDEPTNDLDVETLGSLENALLEFSGCAVVISHDRWFLDRVVTHILAYEGDDENPGKWYWFEGNFEAYEANKVQRLGPEASRPHRVTYRKLTRS